MRRLGSVLFAAGSLILFGVVLVWIVAPHFVPHSPPTIRSLPSSSPLAAPALSPFTPPISSAHLDETRLELTSDETSSPTANNEGSSSITGSRNWNVISYAEAKALSAQDRNFPESSLRLSIPALDIEVPVLEVSLEEKQNGSGRPYRQWTVPNQYAVGWHDSSAPPGQVGNTVLNGHNNVYGAVFGNLVDLTLGEQIILYEADRQHIYQVVHREFLPEKGEPLRTRLRNARWISPSNDERLTIVTCWPNTSNSHRLVLVAQPLIPKPGF